MLKKVHSQDPRRSILVFVPFIISRKYITDVLQELFEISETEMSLKNWWVLVTSQYAINCWFVHIAGSLGPLAFIINNS